MFLIKWDQLFLFTPLNAFDQHQYHSIATWILVCLTPRDYHEELKGALLVLDPGFQYEELAMWKEHAPTAKPMDSNQLAQADTKIDQLVQTQNKLSFDADCLALARDAAQLAAMYREEQKTDRAARLARVLHLKQQNQIGSNLTMDFMMKKCHHVAGPQTDLHAALDKAWVLNSKSIQWGTI